ncbi:SURF1 family protein [Shewanella sp. VB17]|nr:SURF1 family protein [Shewanella sp. VB17]
MKSSNNTKVNLNANNVFTHNPRLCLGGTRVLLIIATVSLFILLVKLGFWQLSRADLKENIQSQLIARQASAPLSFAQLLSFPSTESLTGYRFNATVHPIGEKIFLLDNQIFNGQIGYLALQILQIAPNTPWLLVELGFIPAGADRRQLPTFQHISKIQTLSGRLYQKQTNPMSSALMAEAGWPKRIQNLNITHIENVLQHSVAPAVFQPESILEVDLPHPWKPIPFTAQKHLGYAFQWFSMALVYALLMIYFIKGRLKNNNLETITKQ